ncbi:MAG: 16S rRNA (adenine(1518)-N(6)/adenine(1519)-N(6))-dimethyltransferase RsmA [Patescibacteria group bacterium]|nr:16S rRNA (adenine(1518)-N(6)/adenine(1519)-N(6))-dimethyltransferase RsmA [Patescibacteria group bacterium]MCL5224131.1 16S rRNA (adenine(1518)-N(6)/adenine(1519)-N(6))-dimethyltransferase RsmA [Patescibacteria group bacterium]
MRQRLGQHFLKDENVLKKIASTPDIKEGDIVIEIGPGHGELTKYLLAANPKRLIAIEKDKELADGLKQLTSRTVEVVMGDALKTLPIVVSHLNKPYKIVGNIPYYITGRLMRVLGELGHKPQSIVLTIQKEVAERICSAPPRMNLLAASVQFWGIPSVRGIIKRSCFKPTPKVDSVIISIEVRRPNKESANGYYEFIKTLFKQPRKTVSNNLRSYQKTKSTIDGILTSLSISPTLRPGDLDFDTILKLSSVFKGLA